MALAAAVIGTLLVFLFAIIGGFVAYLRANKGFMTVIKMPTSLPIALIVDAAASPDIETVVWQAAEWWSRSAGGRIFDKIEGSVIVTVLAPEAELIDAYARTSLRIDDKGRVTGAQIHLSSSQTGNLFRALCHELGHILGLEHDEIHASVMYPKAVNGDFVLLEADRALVRARYQL